MDTGSKESLAGLGAMTQRGMQTRDLTSEAMRQDEEIRSQQAMKHAELDSREAIAQYNAQVKLTAEEMKAQAAKERPHPNGS
jgi:hypothetical protein